MVERQPHGRPAPDRETLIVHLRVGEEGRRLSYLSLPRPGAAVPPAELGQRPRRPRRKDRPGVPRVGRVDRDRLEPSRPAVERGRRHAAHGGGPTGRDAREAALDVGQEEGAVEGGEDRVAVTAVLRPAGGGGRRRLRLRGVGPPPLGRGALPVVVVLRRAGAAVAPSVAHDVGPLLGHVLGQVVLEVVHYQPPPWSVSGKV